jgi:DNA-binding transcriptional MerR regulator
MPRLNDFKYARSQVEAPATDVELLTIGELAERTGVATSALRYYDDLGLVRPTLRASGQRRYDAHAVRQVGVVLLLRDVGFSLAEIATLLTDPPRRRETWETLARAKTTELDQVIHDAMAARTALAHSLECPKGDPVACPRFWSIVDDRLAGRDLTEH